jgi:hypothetical protein
LKVVELGGVESGAAAATGDEDSCLYEVEFILPYFIKYSAHFFTLKIMLKYSLCTIHGRWLRKGLRWLV